MRMQYPDIFLGVEVEYRLLPYLLLSAHRINALTSSAFYSLLLLPSPCCHRRPTATIALLPPSPCCHHPLLPLSLAAAVALLPAMPRKIDLTLFKDLIIK